VASGERPSALALQLNATMVSSDPDSSLATVYDRDYKNVAAISVGDEVRPGITIVAIATHRVYIQNGSQIEYIELGEQVPRGGADSASAKPSETRTATSGPASQPDAADDAIKCPSDNLCVVDRKFVDQTLANPAALMRQAAVRPHMNGGEVAGFQLSRIRSGSLPSKLGLKNGDVIAEVNGQAVTSLDGAMALYTKLRHASRLSVTIMRGGKYLSKEIQIQADIG
jgi:general secretion pathway protein C